MFCLYIFRQPKLLTVKNFNREQYAAAKAAWKGCITNYSSIEQLIALNQVFVLQLDQINWLKSKNQYKDFCVEMGVFENQVVIVLCPLDESGNQILLEEYCYSVLADMSQDLKLFEKQEYTIVKTSVLSKDLRKINKNSDINFPIATQPLLEQDKAVDAIESWRNDGKSWFYLECNEPYNGTRVFERFYVPAEDLNFPDDSLNSIVCSFSLKYSDIYQRMLVSLIFISFYENYSNDVTNENFISNTYDWSQPCPPFCNI